MKIKSTIVLVSLALGMVAPSIAVADTTARMYVDCLNVSGESTTLTPGAVEQPVLWIITANMRPNGNLPVNKIGVTFSGTVAATDIVSAHFTTINNNGNLVDLGTAAFNPATKTATLTGVPLYSIPNGYTRDITVRVNVAPGAVVGNNVTFGVQVGNFDYQTNTPPALIDGNFGCSSSPWQIVAPQPPSVSTLAMVSPNGGEVWKIGQRVSVKWAATKIPTGAYFCKVELRQAGNLLTTIRNMSPGYTAQGIAWVVGASAATGGTPDPIVTAANNYRLRVHMCDQNGNQIMQDTSDANFRITN